MHRRRRRCWARKNESTAAAARRRAERASCNSVCGHPASGCLSWRRTHQHERSFGRVPPPSSGRRCLLLAWRCSYNHRDEEVAARTKNSSRRGRGGTSAPRARTKKRPRSQRCGGHCQRTSAHPEEIKARSWLFCSLTKKSAVSHQSSPFHLSTAKLATSRGWRRRRKPPWLSSPSSEQAVRKRGSGPRFAAAARPGAVSAVYCCATHVWEQMNVPERSCPRHFIRRCHSNATLQNLRAGRPRAERYSSCRWGTGGSAGWRRRRCPRCLQKRSWEARLGINDKRPPWQTTGIDSAQQREDSSPLSLWSEVSTKALMAA